MRISDWSSDVCSSDLTRVSATPETVQKNKPMPVRLMGFPRLPNDRRPVYVIEQQNEAIYIRLDPLAVAEYLRVNGVMAAAPPAPRTIGGELIETYQDLDRKSTRLNSSH